MKLLLVLILVLLSGFIYADQEIRILESEELEYSGDKIRMTSPEKVRFRIDPSGMELKAKNLTISPNSENKQQFNTAIAEGAVELCQGPLLSATCDMASCTSDGLLTLQGHVIVKFSDFAVLTTDDELTIKFEDEIKSIRSKGETHLNCESEERDLDFTVDAPHGLYIDHTAHVMELLSPTEHHVERRQVKFQDGSRRIYSDHAHIDYNIISGKISPHQIILDDNVRMSNREGPLLQCVLSDHAEIYPQNQTLVFQSKKPHRVIFYDRVNNLRMSAPEMKVWKDPLTQKESVQGSGEVRFRFLERELEQLRKYFQLEKSQVS